MFLYRVREQWVCGSLNQENGSKRFQVPSNGHLEVITKIVIGISLDERMKDGKGKYSTGTLVLL